MISPDITLQRWSARGAGGMKLQKYFRHGSFAEQMMVPTENRLAHAIAPKRCNGAHSTPCSCPMAASSQRSSSRARRCWSAAPPAISAARRSWSRSPWARPAWWRRAVTRRDLGISSGASARVQTVTLSGNENDDCERMKKAASAGIDYVMDILPTSAPTTAVRAAIMAVRPCGRVVLMGGVGMLGGAGRDLPYPLDHARLYHHPRRLDVPAGRGAPPDQSGARRTARSHPVRSDDVRSRPRRWRTRPPTLVRSG